MLVNLLFILRQAGLLGRFLLELEGKLTVTIFQHAIANIIINTRQYHFRVKFKQINKFEPGEVYTGGCLRELANCLYGSDDDDEIDIKNLKVLQKDEFLKSPNVLYIGDSLFADLVDAKREFGWTTATVTPEIADEIEIQSSDKYLAASKTIHVLIDLLRGIQAELGTSERSDIDAVVLDKLERMLSLWRDEQSVLLGNPFGSIFRARHQPSLFAHCIRRYCDLYMSDIGCLRHYSPEHRFYPDESRLLSHEINLSGSEYGWD